MGKSNSNPQIRTRFLPNNEGIQFEFSANPKAKILYYVLRETLEAFFGVSNVEAHPWTMMIVYWPDWFMDEIKRETKKS